MTEAFVMADADVQRPVLEHRSVARSAVSGALVTALVGLATGLAFAADALNGAVGLAVFGTVVGSGLGSAWSLWRWRRRVRRFDAQHFNVVCPATQVMTLDVEWRCDG